MYTKIKKLFRACIFLVMNSNSKKYDKIGNAYV